MGLGEWFADEGLSPSAGFDGAPLPNVEAVQAAAGTAFDGDESSDSRLAHARDIESHVHDHAGVHPRDAGDRRNALPERVGGPLEVGKNLRETVAVVIGFPSRFQGRQGSERHDKDRNPAGHDEGDGEGLPFHLQEIAHELSMESVHDDYQASSRAAVFFALRRMSTILPPDRRMTRSAISEMMALCVMTAVVVPNSRLMRSMASSTRIPV
ncbi:hypothetical protein DSTSK_20360 [Desulforhabdus sp. TSK]|nr:hypothetical protein DSTSK_20360 [Desulforhabdus sp. TSK]